MSNILEKDFTSLPFPVTFVCRYQDKWSNLFLGDETPIPDPDAIPGQIVTNEDCWIVLTYLHLKRRNLNVKLSNRFLPGKICIASALDFGIRDQTFSSFVVGCRSDGPKPALCNVAIVQNQANVESKTDIFIPHWLQPGLIQRNSARGNRIENLVFKGSETNLYEAFRSPQFCQELENLGVKLQINGLQKNQPVEWHDYSEADLVLAVRDLTEKDALVKPASKLVNAWTAGVPALLGPEPAFQALQKSHLDYIEVKTPLEVFEAIRRLKQDPSLYQQMILNGQNRAKEFSTEQIALRWHEVLSTQVASLYSRWRQHSYPHRVADFTIRALNQKIAVRAADYHRHHGYRPVSGRWT
ncbi:MAG: glycosyltransferase family 1 protein [Calothrix sp. C42_A2020_038]|nr:glycosyltransferase family 1 protein [Calothrix sp. C42_A2020_038]